MAGRVAELDSRFFGPWALVTGASSGIGAEAARQLAASGLHLVLTARKKQALDDLAAELESGFGIKTRTIVADLREDNFLESLVAATDDIEVGLIYSNAGTGVPGAFHRIDEEMLLGVIKLNSIAQMRIARHFGQKMIARRRGGILFVSALGSQEGIPTMANDGASKAYVTSLGSALHNELRSYGVHCTVMIPGPTETPVIDKFGLDRATMPMKPMPVQKTVAESLRALCRNKRIILTGRLFRVLYALVPKSVFRNFNGKMLSQGLVDGAPRTSHL